MSIVRASVQNWFTNDNMRMKSKIEARCGMYVYLMNRSSSIMTIFSLFLPELCPFFVLPVC